MIEMASRIRAVASVTLPCALALAYWWYLRRREQVSDLGEEEYLAPESEAAGTYKSAATPGEMPATADSLMGCEENQVATAPAEEELQGIAAGLVISAAKPGVLRKCLGSEAIKGKVVLPPPFPCRRPFISAPLLGLETEEGRGSTVEAGLPPLHDVHSMDSVGSGCCLEVDEDLRSDGQTTHLKNSQLVKWEIELPEHLVGPLIGNRGKNLNFLKQRSGANIYIMSWTQEFHICHIMGTQQQVERALFLIEKKFKNLDLTNVYDPPHLPVMPPSLPIPTLMESMDYNSGRVRVRLGGQLLIPAVPARSS